MSRHYIWPTIVNCIAPAGFLGLAALSTMFGAENILSNQILGIPSVYVGISLICVALFSIFRSHFNHSVDDRLVWFAIFFSGIALILLFTFIYRAEGILCTAPLCPGTSKVLLSDPRFLTHLGEAHLADLLAVDGNTQTAALDRSFVSSLYYSTVTFTTLGYGDFQPVVRLRPIAGIQALIGYGFLGMVVGLLIDLGNRQKWPSA